MTTYTGRMDLGNGVRITEGGRLTAAKEGPEYVVVTRRTDTNAIHVERTRAPLKELKDSAFTVNFKYAGRVHVAVWREFANKAKRVYG